MIMRNESVEVDIVFNSNTRCEPPGACITRFPGLRFTAPGPVIP